MSEATRAFVAIGSNLEPAVQVPRALAALRALPDTWVFAVSGWYRTAPWGLTEQPDFVNLVAGLETRLTAPALLAATQAIETAQGRERTVPNGPRTLDLDLLLFGLELRNDPELRLPHPGLAERDFMLIPLIEIAPAAVHPGLGCPVSALTGGIRYRQIRARLDGLMAAKCSQST